MTRRKQRTAAPGLLRLYVAGNGARSLAARRSLDTLLEHPEFVGRMRRIVIDVCRQPMQAKQAALMATPTLLVSSGERSRRFIGDFSDVGPLLEFLQRELVRARG